MSMLQAKINTAKQQQAEAEKVVADLAAKLKDADDEIERINALLADSK